MLFEIFPTLFLFCLNSKYVVNKALKPFFSRSWGTVLLGKLGSYTVPLNVFFMLPAY